MSDLKAEIQDFSERIESVIEHLATMSVLRKGQRFEVMNDRLVHVK